MSDKTRCWICGAYTNSHNPDSVCMSHDQIPVTLVKTDSGVTFIEKADLAKFVEETKADIIADITVPRNGFIIYERIICEKELGDFDPGDIMKLINALLTGLYESK